MKLHHSLSLAAVAAALALASGAALAESQYGYLGSGGAAAVTAQARVNLSVTVPKLILLRVGTAGATQDNLLWTVPLTIPTAPASLVDGSNQAATWTGAAPGVGTITNPAAVSVWAWTNSSGGGSLNYAATAFAPTGGPALGDIAVASATGLAHPSAVLAAAGSAVTFTRNAVQTGSWTYSLGGTPASWAAGAYTSTVTYTATSI